MRFPGSILALGALVAALACTREGAEEVPEADTTDQDEMIMSVPDSTIERELTARIGSDPRLEVEGVEVTVRSEEGAVWLRGRVPTRFEMAIAREVALSTPGVRNVVLDSLVIASEAGAGSEAEAESGT